ncbi:hypothetical protein MTO96_011007 [Rhipicephalus appendiculatus]
MCGSKWFTIKCKGRDLQDCNKFESSQSSEIPHNQKKVYIVKAPLVFQLAAAAAKCSLSGSKHYVTKVCRGKHAYVPLRSSFYFCNCMQQLGTRVFVILITQVFFLISFSTWSVVLLLCGYRIEGITLDEHVDCCVCLTCL